MAHVSLAQAEFSQIAAEIKRFAIAAGIVFGMLVFAGMLVVIGGTLFVGEWLFGSIGWGILHGLEFAVAASVVEVWCFTCLGIPTIWRIARRPTL